MTRSLVLHSTAASLFTRVKLNMRDKTAKCIDVGNLFTNLLRQMFMVFCPNNNLKIKPKINSCPYYYKGAPCFYIQNPLIGNINDYKRHNVQRP